MKHTKTRMTVETAIHNVVTSNESFKVLPRGTWTAGGCGILADAILKIWSYAGAGLYTVTDMKTGVAHHILVHMGRYYYDGNGKSTRAQLLKYWKYKEGLARPALVPLQEWPEDIDRNTKASMFIAQMLLKQFERLQ
ncbi:MAG: hypothetical protein JRN21_09710 [Nitrososphaerota archaeon]|nr:hypothetical protein [Nitrososphaerota archaeon]